MKRWKIPLGLCATLVFIVLVTLAWAGTAKVMKYGIRFYEESASHGTPPAGTGEVYVKDNGGTMTLYFKDDQENETSCIYTSASTAWDDIGNPDADKTITFDDNEITILSFADTNEDMFTVKGVGDFGDVSVVKIEQSTGNPTDGTLVEIVTADANVDPLVVSASGKANAFVVGQNTGVVTIAGVAEGTSALTLTAGDILLSDGDIHVDAGDCLFDEDVTISGNLAVTGTSTLTGTFYTSALAPSSGNITLNGAGSGTVSIGNSSTGAIILTGGGVDIGDGATDTLSITGIVDSNVTLDDGTTDSPKLIFKDSDDEQHEFYADQDTDDLNLECANADDSLAITVGNFSIGTPNASIITMDGGDGYCDDDFEVKGTLAVGTDLDLNGTANISSTATIATVSVGTLLDVNEDVDVDFDANDEEVNVTSSATDYAADTAMVTLFNSGAGQTNAHYLLRLRHTADGDAQDHFLIAEDNNGDDMFKVDSGGAVTAAGTVTGQGTITAATIQATTLLDVNEDVDVDFDANDEEVNVTSSATDYAADTAMVTLFNSGAGQTNNHYLLRLRHTADGDAQDHFLIAEDNNGDDMFKVDSGGAVTATGLVAATGGLSGGNVSTSYLKTDNVELSNADIKGLRASPKELVAAPGANTFLEFVGAVLILDYGSEVLTETDDNLVIQYGTSGADVTAAIETTGFIDQAVDQMALINAAGIATDAASDIVNNKLELFNTGDGEFGGNASNDTTMTVKITYRVHADGL